VTSEEVYLKAYEIMKRAEEAETAERIVHKQLNYLRTGDSDKDISYEAAIVARLLSNNPLDADAAKDVEKHYTTIRKGFNKAMKAKFVWLCQSLYTEEECIKLNILKKRETPKKKNGVKDGGNSDSDDPDSVNLNDEEPTSNNNDNLDGDAMDFNHVDMADDNDISNNSKKRKRSESDGESDADNANLNMEYVNSDKESFKTCPYLALIKWINEPSKLRIKYNDAEFEIRAFDASPMQLALKANRNNSEDNLLKPDHITCIIGRLGDGTGLVVMREILASVVSFYNAHISTITFLCPHTWPKKKYVLDTAVEMFSSYCQ
jgi:hypothetical protein